MLASLLDKSVFQLVESSLDLRVFKLLSEYGREIILDLEWEVILQSRFSTSKQVPQWSLMAKSNTNELDGLIPFRNMWSRIVPVIKPVFDSLK